MVMEMLGRILRAETTPARVLGVAPGILNGMYAVALVAHKKGQLDVADDLFLRCVRMDPFKSEYWIALASTRQSRGKAEEAGELYQVASVLTEDIAPVAYAAACFAEAGLLRRATVLADYVREHAPGAEHLEPWLSTVDQAVLLEEAS